MPHTWLRGGGCNPRRLPRSGSPCRRPPRPFPGFPSRRCSRKGERRTTPSPGRSEPACPIRVFPFPSRSGSLSFSGWRGRSRRGHRAALRRPGAFRALPRAAAQAKGNGKARFGITGRAQISGSLLALEHSRGTLSVQRLAVRDGGIDLTGEGITITLSSDGIRWGSGTVRTAGNPLRVAGKASWAGDLDVRLDGQVPATAIRLATDVFDRLDGMIRMELRVTGKWNDPSVIGTGHLENGFFSFRGYAQLFEEMNADAVISREKIIFEHFEGRSGGGGLDGRGGRPFRVAGRRHK